MTKACSGMKQGPHKWPQSRTGHKHPWVSLNENSTDAWLHTKACSAHPNVPKIQPRAAISAPTQPAQGLATFAPLSPAGNSRRLLPQPRAQGAQLGRAPVASSPPEPYTLRASSPCRTHAAGPALARSQLQSRSYLALIKNIPRWKEPKGCFFPAAPGWRGFEGCRPRPAKCTAHRRLRPQPDCGSSAPRGLFLAPVKKEKQGAGGRQRAGRCPAGPRDGDGRWLRRVHWPPSTCPAGPCPLAGGGRAPGPRPSPGGEQ